MQSDILSLLAKKTVEVMAVSKAQPVANIENALEDGHRFFGENRVQEAQKKWPGLLKAYPDCRLHLIGPLQTNKAKQAIGLFHGIEVIDRPALVDTLVRYISLPTARTEEFLIQVNIGEEPQKSGVLPKDFQYLRQYCQERQLPVRGLMCIPPVTQDPRPYFEKMKLLAIESGLEVLSMGMSQDYETAIKCGSTRIRLGTAIFGPLR